MRRAGNRLQAPAQHIFPTSHNNQIVNGVRALCSRQVVGLWREDLRKVNPKAAEALADPSQYANLFPNMAEALQAESLQVGAPQSQVCMSGVDMAAAGSDLLPSA